jgi:hypothetical protein
MLARPTDAGVTSEMWERGLAHAERIAAAHEADLAPYLRGSYLHPSGAMGGGADVGSAGGGGTVLAGLPSGVNRGGAS